MHRLSIALALSTLLLVSICSAQVGGNGNAVINGSGTVNYIPIWTTPNYLGTSVIYQASGNIGIGTTTPLATLDVNGGINTATIFQIGGSTVLSIGLPPSYTNNTLVGFEAGSAEGLGGTYVGYGAGFRSIGEENTMMGYLAGGQGFNTGSGNSFYGGEAAVNNTSGSHNVVVGESAGGNTTGSDNTYVGTGAGAADHVGNGDTFIGLEAGGDNGGGSSNIYIGNYGTTESNVIRIGDPNVTDPYYQTAAYIAGIYNSPVANTNPVCVLATGQLGVCNSSSRRFKDQIADMGDSSSKLFQLRPVSFFYKPQYDDGTHAVQYGLIAEEVAKIYPDLVTYDKAGQPNTVKYQLLAPMLLNELEKEHKVVMAQQDELQTQLQQIKAQQQWMQAQSQEINSLKHELQLQNASLQERLSKLESYVATQTQMKTASNVQPATAASPSGDSQ